MVPSIHSIGSRLLLGLALLACLVASPLRASAQEPAKKPSAEEMARAKKHYQNALDHHGHKEYLAAAKEYEKAFTLFPNPEFVFNAAQVYRLDGKVLVALEQYQRYLELDKDGRGAADARAHIASLKIELAEIERQEQASNDAEAIRLAEEARKAKETKRRDEEERAAASLRGSGSSRDPGNRTLRIAGLASLGVGVIAMVVGGTFALDAKALEHEVTGNTVWSQQDFDKGQDAERNAVLFIGVGAAAFVGGGVIYWLGRGGGSRDRKESGLSIVPAPNARGGGLLVRGDF